MTTTAGQIARKAMAAQGLTIDYVHSRTGMAPLTIRAFLADERQPSVRTVQLMAAALGLDEAHLLRAAGYAPGAAKRVAVVDLRAPTALLERLEELERRIGELEGNCSN